MKLKYFQLEAHLLAKKLAPIYIVSGDELLLKRDAIHFIRKAAIQAGFKERIRLTPEAGFDWEQLYPRLYSASLLATKNLIELDFRDITPNKTASLILKEYGEKPSPDHLLLIDIGKLDNKISKSDWYRSLEKTGIVVNIWPIPHEQLPQWIMQRAKKYKLQINFDAARLLSDYVEGNLAAAAQALEKIYLSQPKTSVDLSLIQTMLTNESRFSLFDFIENLIADNKSRALHILANLKEEGVEPILILWGITRELRLLAELAKQLQLGMSFEELWKKHAIFLRRQAGMRHFLTRHSVENCWQYLTQAAHIDRMIKGAALGNVWNALELFCLRI